MLFGKRITICVLTGLFLVSAWLSYEYFKPLARIKIKDKIIRINPNVQIDPVKEYCLRVWDYDLPLKNCNYRQYMQKAVADFQKIYPNIRVELRFLDLLTGHGQLEAALEQGDPPDLYCSAFSVPHFDLDYQIPVGPYLKTEELENAYPLSIQKLVQVDGVFSYFPRWLRWNLWVANRSLAEAAGFEVNKIQQQGWTWTQLFAAKDKYPATVYSMVGNVIPMEVLRQILPNGCFVERQGESSWEWLQQLKESQRLPEDFNSNMLDRFLSGQVMFLAGISPIMLRVIRERLTQQGAAWEGVALPVPELSKGRAIHSVEAGVICVYRNRKRKGGSDHLAAAVKLGEYLSTYRDSSPWEELMVMPAARQVTLKWLQKQEPEQYPAVLEYMLNHNNLTIINIDESYREKTAALLLKYLTGKINREETIQQLKAEIYCD
ncbi:MAG TPA: extracellular solute-binding protein [Bacillota bacterium]